MTNTVSKIRILYFGRLSTAAGRNEECLELPSDITTVNALKTWLNARHDLGSSLHDPSIKTMINQSLAHGNASINHAKEIGFLPPVGGG